MSDSNSIGDGMALFRHQQSPPLDLKAVEALRCERTGNLIGTDTMPLGTACPCLSCRRYFALVPALLALLLETRSLLTDLLPIADGVPPIAARIRALLAKARDE